LRGITLAMQCEDAYEVNKLALKHYDEAFKCFTKAGELLAKYCCSFIN
jgi:hypothetical protein